MQRVSAIVKSGTWSAERNWSDTGNWSEKSKTDAVSNLGGAAYNFGNDSFSVAGGQMRTKGATSTSGSSSNSGHEASSGASDLARSFDRPKLQLTGHAPQPPLKPCKGLSVHDLLMLPIAILIFVCVAGPCIMISGPDMIGYLGVAASLILFLISGLFMNKLKQSASHQVRAEMIKKKDLFDMRLKEYEQALATFQADQVLQQRVHDTATRRWEDTFYCHRCDHVYLPGTIQAVRADNLKDLLYA